MMEEKNQQLLSALESALSEHILRLQERKAGCGELRSEDVKRFIEHASHRCVAGALKDWGADVIAGKDLATLVMLAREPLDAYYREIGFAFDSEAMSMIKEFDAERAAILILGEALQGVKQMIRAEATARKASAEMEASARSWSSLARKFLTAIILW
jgi:hypothetical protein